MRRVFLLFFFIVFLFIIVFDVIYMLLPWYVICSKIAVKKKTCLFSSLQRFFEVSVFTVRTLIENLLCVVCSLCHIAAHHTIGAKRLNLGFIFCPHVCGLSHL